MLLKYIIFAIISTFFNILIQALSLFLYKGVFDLQIAILCGTGFGFLLKYFLDKKYVFYHTTDDIKKEGKTFGLYTLMGVFTTLIFWFTEMLFNFLIDYSWSKYLGAIIGLGIGYFIKYQLDKKYVFY
ncbi:GtrA family protein [Chondrinema litorale]|uniref:GtrA family protein n=1 Tax=Chondrinema litorale TaxID=2994555 RepID=UPI00254298EC|nr:GtrA family protein [Chondrinema litorale]UZS00099.1 GtrA family protein [Chondrinema litorale]